MPLELQVPNWTFPTLEPLAIGTPDCESLSGYIQRCCGLLGILPGQLVSRVLGWLAAEHVEQIGHWKRRCGNVPLNQHANGFGGGRQFSALLHAVTGRTDLEKLTIGTWDWLVPTRGVLRPSLGWCPACLASDPIPYHRLSWALQPVTVCAIHKTSLASLCPTCGREVPVLHDRSQILFCSRCGGDLRRAGAAPVVSDYSFWVAQEIAVLIAGTSATPRNLRVSSTSLLRALLIARGCRDNVQIAKRLGTSKVTVWTWLSGASRPSLPWMLKIWYAFGARLSEAARGCVGLADPMPVQLEFHLRPTRHPRVIDWHQIKQQLKNADGASSSEVISLLEFSRRVEIAPKTLRTHFPALCRRLAKRHRRQRHLGKMIRQKLLFEEILNAVRSLRRAGAPITPGAISIFLEKSGLFCRHDARDAMRAAVRQAARFPPTTGKDRSHESCIQANRALV